MTSVVFSGHMIDSADRTTPRFPPDHVARVDAAVRSAVDSITDPEAEAFSGAASGGDLLFCIAWLEGGRRLTVFLPRETEAFLDESVSSAGEEWVQHFAFVVEHPATTLIGPEPGMDELEDPHTPNNLRMLERARQAAPPIRGVFVWDGAGGDGPGGTGHMVRAVRESGGEATVIEP
ncbi:MAG: hypothetical protein ACFCVC_12450 [Acidimicrobiia bacterium]